MPVPTPPNSRDKVVFSDLNLSYDSRAAEPNDMVFNEESLNKAIVTILGTRRGSRVFRRDFGSNLVDMLFEPIDEITAQRIESEILRAIGDYESRITMRSATVIPDYAEQRYFVELEYVIPQLNNKSSEFSYGKKAPNSCG